MHCIQKLSHGCRCIPGKCKAGRGELAGAGSLSEGAKPLTTGLDQERGRGSPWTRDRCVGHVRRPSSYIAEYPLKPCTQVLQHQVFDLTPTLNLQAANTLAATIWYDLRMRYAVVARKHYSASLHPDGPCMKAWPCLLYHSQLQLLTGRSPVKGEAERKGALTWRRHLVARAQTM